MVPRLFSQFLTADNDGTTIDATGNYASVAKDFLYVPATGTGVKLARMIVSIEDSNGMQAEEYGNLGAALTNGIEVFMNQDGTEIDLTDPNGPIKTNAQWGMYCYDVDLKSWGAGDELMLIRWTFERSGAPIYLQGNGNDQLIVRLNDSFTGLVAHRFLIQGINLSQSD